MIVRSATLDDSEACTGIVRRLPDHFTQDVPGKVEADCAAHPTWVLDDAGTVIAFAVVEMRPPHAAEILWMAVAPDRRGGGAGTRLLDHVLDALAAEDIRLIEAKTLDASASYAPYEATRAFWERRGFAQIDTIDPLPGWPPGNPAAIYVAALAATRGTPRPA